MASKNPSKKKKNPTDKVGRQKGNLTNRTLDSLNKSGVFFNEESPPDIKKEFTDSILMIDPLTGNEITHSQLTEKLGDKDYLTRFAKTYHNVNPGISDKKRLLKDHIRKEYENSTFMLGEEARRQPGANLLPKYSTFRSSDQHGENIGTPGIFADILSADPSLKNSRGQFGKIGTMEFELGGYLSSILGGASAGSNFGPWGAAGGAALGALTELAMGDSKKIKRDKQQKQLQQAQDKATYLSDLAQLEQFQKKGGWIQKATKRMEKKGTKGSFSKAAKRAGKTTKQYANQIMSNKSNYSPAMVKKANFAKNVSKKKGGSMGTDAEVEHGEYLLSMTKPNVQSGGKLVYRGKDPQTGESIYDVVGNTHEQGGVNISAKSPTKVISEDLGFDDQVESGQIPSAVFDVQEASKMKKGGKMKKYVGGGLLASQILGAANAIGNNQGGANQSGTGFGNTLMDILPFASDLARGLTDLPAPIEPVKQRPVSPTRVSFDDQINEAGRTTTAAMRGFDQTASNPNAFKAASLASLINQENNVRGQESRANANFRNQANLVNSQIEGRNNMLTNQYLSELLQHDVNTKANRLGALSGAMDRMTMLRDHKTRQRNSNRIFDMMKNYYDKVGDFNQVVN